jgi:predicted amino acid racemase
LKIILFFGGRSPEHDVSIASAVNVLNGLDKRKHTVGASSDHMIVDISDNALHYRVGDRMTFRVSSYRCVIAGMASPYIHRVYRDAPASGISGKVIS